MKRESIIKLLSLVVFLIVLISCVNIQTASPCKHKYIQHVDSNGNSAGYSWYVDCKEE